MLSAAGGGENSGEVIAPEADDIAGERGEIAKQGVEAVHWERFAVGWVGAFADGLAFAAGEGSAFATGEVRCASRAAGSGSSNSIGARRWRMCHSR